MRATCAPRGNARHFRSLEAGQSSAGTVQKVAQRRSFIAELGRRHVWRAAVLYAGAVWALSQGISQLTPALGLPDYATRWFLIAAAIAFPFWIAFAWLYAWTPEGFKREDEVERDPSLTHSTGRKLDFAIIGVLVVAVALLASGYFIRRGAPANASVASAKFDPPADTLVVLPFANLGGDPKQQYFSDGITEELTNALGRNTALRVIAWDTASRYRDSKQSATAIAKALDVANVLTGKILRQGDEVRVIVELVNARTGYQTWSSHYDDALSNIFQVQDKISASIADALKVKFAAANTQRTVNPQAYDLVLKARALVQASRSTAAPLRQAHKLLEQAIALAPDYAEAHALLARTWLDLVPVSTLASKDALSSARKEANKALQLDPRNVDAIIALAYADNSAGLNARAKTRYEHALALDPSNATAHLDYGTMLPPKQELVQTQIAARLDPGDPAAQNNLAVVYEDLGEYRQALAPSLAQMKLTPQSVDSALGLAALYALLHQDEDAVKAFDLARPDTDLGKALLAAGRLAYRSLLDPALHAQALRAANALYRRSDLDPTSQYDLMLIYLVLGRKDPALKLLDKSCEPVPYECDDLAINPAYIPLRGDPRFEALVKKYAATPRPPVSAASTP